MIEEVDTRAPVSVVVPAYNAEGTIDVCLWSILGQTLKPAEIIVIDDGSRDGTLAKVRIVERAAPHVAWIILTQKNLGAGAARNAGLAAATQKFVAFLDADDCWFAEKLEQSMAGFTDGVSIVSHDMIEIDEQGRQSDVICSRHLAQAGNPYHALFLRGFIATSTVVTLRQPLVDLGGFDPSLRAAQDYDIWLRLCADPAVKLRILPLRLTRYARRSGSITSHAFRRLVCGIRIIWKAYPDLRRRGFKTHRLIAVKSAMLVAEYLKNLRR